MKGISSPWVKLVSNRYYCSPEISTYLIVYTMGGMGHRGDRRLNILTNTQKWKLGCKPHVISQEVLFLISTDKYLSSFTYLDFFVLEASPRRSEGSL